METSLRVVLLLVGIFIIAGIIWDTWRARKSFKGKQRTRSLTAVVRHDGKRDPRQAEIPFDHYAGAATEPYDDLFDDVVVVKKLKKNNTTSATTVISTPEEQQNSLEIQSDSNRNDVTPIILNIMARKPAEFLGKKLHATLLECNLVYGEMQIFHYFEHQDGSGDIIFSVASAVEPGFFDLNKMDSVTTPGITLFFVPQTPNQAIAAFELMLRVSKQLAQRLDGELRNEQRKILTPEMIDGYRERVRMPKGLRSNTA